MVHYVFKSFSRKVIVCYDDGDVLSLGLLM